MEFLTTKGIAASIERIIRNAKDFIVIISPYVKVDKTYIDRLYEAEKNNIKIHLIFGKDDMREFEKEKFKNFRNIHIYFLENLHAKCYMNEKTVLITSMNLYGYSEANNREMGIEIQKADNYELYKDINKEALSIADSAEAYNINSWNSEKNDRRNHIFINGIQYNTGHCIRCNERIKFEISRPLCDDCYWIWVQFGNEDYPERFCHKCGREINFGQPIDYAHPLCYDCWRDIQKM